MVGTGSATRAGNRTAKSESRRTVWAWRAAWACGALRTRIGCEGVEVSAGVSSVVAVLVIVVGAEERENAWIGEALAEHAAISMSPHARGLTVVNTDYTSVGAREKMYARGGVYSITSRILVVDLLTNLLDADRITGVILLHAEKVIATSLEAFILRLYRQKNKAGFLKAFSDSPEPFTYGFSPLATMMKNMFLRKASLWPRFHVTVAGSLEGKKKAEVIEL